MNDIGYKITNFDHVFKAKSNTKLESNSASLSKLICGFIRELNEKELKNTNIPLVIYNLIINNIPCLIVSNDANENIYSSQYCYLNSDEKQIYGFVNITNTTYLTCNAFQRTENKGGKIIIKCLGDFIIDENCGIDVNAKGYERGNGTATTGGSYQFGPIRNASSNNDGGGGPGQSAGYGTPGEGSLAGNAYGDKYISKLHLGSGGGCDRAGHVAGEGGGAIYLETFNLINNGCIVANGGSGNCCGSGSGGSIHINVANKLTMNHQNASIEAIGGHSRGSKPGVGRIRIQVKDNKIAESILLQIKPKPYIG